MGGIQIFSLILIIIFIIVVGTINLFMINFAPRHKIKLSHWISIPLAFSLWLETKNNYVNSILPLFFLMYFIFEIIFILAYTLNFKRFRYRYFFRQSRKFLNLLLFGWYFIFFIISFFNN
ncbi:DUF3397 family protein [Xylocopilactobacillus apis]|uniref:DUF3397 family protein n=1 Tax=Xylocopilactobacillus apis TaxID=2932183 RepID=UPI003CE48005